MRKRSIDRLRGQWVGKTVGSWFNKDAVVVDVKPYRGAFDFVHCIFTLTGSEDGACVSMSIDDIMMDKLERTGRL